MTISWDTTGVADADASLMRALIDIGLTRLHEEFKTLGGASLLAGLMLHVKVHSGNGKEAAVQIPGERGPNSATLELLAPSRQPPHARTLVGEPKDRNYLHKTVIHELSMLYPWRATSRKPQGWPFFSAPDWFIDGFEEYIALTCASQHTLEVTLPLYRRLWRERWRNGPPQSMDCYIDGSAIVAFLYDRFGRDRMEALLLDTAPTFESALSRVLSTNVPNLRAQCHEWIGWHETWDSRPK